MRLPTRDFSAPLQCAKVRHPAALPSSDRSGSAPYQRCTQPGAAVADSAFGFNHHPVALCSCVDEIIRLMSTRRLSSACRTAFLVAVAGLTAGVCLVSAASSLALLWVAAPLAGFAFGCHWSLMPPLASELFGMRSFASLYCLLQFATTFGTYAFATRLVRAGEGPCRLLPSRRLLQPLAQELCCTC